MECDEYWSGMRYMIDWYPTWLYCSVELWLVAHYWGRAVPGVWGWCSCWHATGALGSCGMWLLTVHVQPLVAPLVASKGTQLWRGRFQESHDTVRSDGRQTAVAFGRPSLCRFELSGAQYWVTSGIRKKTASESGHKDVRIQKLLAASFSQVTPTSNTSRGGGCELTTLGTWLATHFGGVTRRFFTVCSRWWTRKNTSQLSQENVIHEPHPQFAGLYTKIHGHYLHCMNTLYRWFIYLCNKYSTVLQ